MTIPGPLLRALPALFIVAAGIIPAPSLGARTPPPPVTADDDVIWRLRREVAERSALMSTLARLTDLYGPRLTGSPNLRRAQDWIVRQAEAWRLERAHLEPWDFGHAGWQNERASVHLTAPVQDPLVAEVLAWTPGTSGAVTATTILVEPPVRPSQARLDEFFATWRGKLAGKAVLVGRSIRVDVAFDSPRRRDDNEMRARFSADGPVGPAGPGPSVPPPASGGPPPLTADQFAEQLNAFFVNERVALRINDAGRAHAQIRAFNNRTFDVSKAVPTIVLRNEDYGRIARLMAAGEAVSLEADIVNRSYPEGRTQQNVIAEIRGTDKAREVVMLGAHLDSWHAATGATDNAVGAAVMLEVMRALRAAGVQPRRTIRLALWSGEEQGLRGSSAYVNEHFGSFENPKPEFDDLVAYFNLDSGTGRARGLTVFGPPAAARMLRPLLEPFATAGVMGVTTTRSRARGGSDHSSFNAAGLTGISVGQDPIEYDSHTWHTNLDTYERVVESDAQQAATVIAAAVYHAATSDDRLPRFTRAEMPSPPRPPAP